MSQQTSRMGFPFPSENDDPWFDPFQEFAAAVDSAEFSEADNNNLIPTGEAIFLWDLASSTLAWDAPFYFSGFTTAFRARIEGPAGTAPTLANGGAGLVEAGKHRYLVTFVSGAGEVSAGPSAMIDLAVASQVNISAIPIGPVGTTARKIYRTEADGFYYALLATIANNVTTVFADNLADASLGAQIAFGIVRAEVSLLEGQVAYFNMPRLTTQETVVDPVVAMTVVNSVGELIYDKIVICTRKGGRIYFRNGIALGDGGFGPVWERPSAPGSVGMTPTQKAAVNSALHIHVPFIFDEDALANLPNGTTVITLPDPSPESYVRVEVYKNGLCLTEGATFDYTTNLGLFQITLDVPTLNDMTHNDRVKIVAEQSVTVGA